MKKVSVIVPVYNAKDTLINCVGSLVKQTLQDIEIILVNDCSTDNSLLIMQLLKEKFPDKIVLIDSPVNQGAGGARNLGVAAASGEYIGFVDSDDLVDPTMYEKLYHQAVRTGYDIIDCGFVREATGKAVVYTSDDLTGELDDEKRSRLIVAGGYIWSKIFKTSFFKSPDFVFRNHAILEDSEIIAFAFATAKSIGNVKEALYLYKDTADSLSKAADPKHYYNSCLDAMKAIYDKLSPLPGYEGIRESVEYEMLQLYSYAVNACLTLGIEDSDFDVVSRLKEIRKFRSGHITPGYCNRYVKAKIEPEAVRIMELNDRSPEELAMRVHKK